MCPLEALKSKEDKDGDSPLYQDIRLYVDEFEKACNLEDESKPSPKSKEWLMRWRGKEDDGHIYGGETKAQGEFNFKYDTKAKESEVNAMTIAFGMVHKGRHLIFHGSKVANLEFESEDESWSLESEWQAMFDPEWEVDSESDIESDGSIYKKPKDPPKGGLIKAKNKPGPNPGFMPNSLTFGAAQSTFTATPAAQIPLPLWDGTGKYNITSGESYGPTRNFMKNFTGSKHVDTTGFSLKIFYYRQSLPHQLYATFCFDKLEGVMQLCPRNALKKKFTQADFTRECYLKEEMAPGPEHPKWAMRWRGIDGGMQLNKRVGGDTRDLGEFDFEEDDSTSSAGFVGVKIKICMIYKGHLFMFDAFKIATLDAIDKAQSSDGLGRKWESLDDPEWYEPAQPDSESDSDSGSDSGPTNRWANRPQAAD